LQHGPLAADYVTTKLEGSGPLDVDRHSCGLRWPAPCVV